MNVLIIGFNLYKGGSLQIREFVTSSLMKLSLDKNQYFLFVSSDFKVNEQYKQNNLKIIKIIYPCRFKFLNSTYRLFYEQIFPIYLKWKYNIDKLILFNNVPVLLIKDNIQSIYFHNLNYIKFFSFQKIYFILVAFFKKNTTYFVQSTVVANELKKNFKGKIIIAKHPLLEYYLNIISQEEFNARNSNLLSNLDQNGYIYPAYFYPHKNHIQLKNLEDILKKNKIKIYLTIDDKSYEELFHNSETIINLGKLKNIEILNVIQKLKGLINVSLNESFMLPIIEAMVLKKQVITLKMSYSQFLLKDKGLYFSDEDSFDRALKKGINIHEIDDYDFKEINCDNGQFIYQFIDN